MSDGPHKILPVRQGRYVTCRTCGYLVMHVRATKLIRKAHWKHQGHQNSPEFLALHNPNRTI